MTRYLLSVISRLPSTEIEHMESVNICIVSLACALDVASLSAITMAASSACSVDEPFGRRKEAVQVLEMKPQPAVCALGSTEPSVK